MAKHISDEERKAKSAAREQRETSFVSACEHIVGGHLMPWQREQLVRATRQLNSGQPIRIDLPDGRVFTP